MKRVLLALVIVGAVTVGTVGLTRSFFSDTETGRSNTFEAGAIDLKIDNASYYNGLANPGTSWDLKDLTVEKFFNFGDLKPGDWGEDTISVHVNDNDAWACMNLTVTKNDDNTCTKPELNDDPSCNPSLTDNGELAARVNFVFWLDDGDNVLEDNEKILVKNSLASFIFNPLNIVLADALQNNVGGAAGHPLVGSRTYHLGKAWCFGELHERPLPQDGVGNARTPLGSPENGGITCDGSSLNNATQSDITMADVSFSAIQSRNNPNYLCFAPPPATSPTLTPAPKLIEELTIQANNPAGAVSSTTLVSGKNYRLDIGGTWLNRNGHDTVDADFVSYDGFATPGMDGDPGWTVFGLTDYGHLLDTQVNNTFIDWGPYTPTHQYSAIIPGNNSQFTFRIFDGVPETNTQNLGWYADNSGSLQIAIYELP